MIIETVQDYNRRKTVKYHEDCQKWQPDKSGFPCYAMYIFEKNYGFVASGGRVALWRKTKKQVVADFTKSYGEGLN
jgi:hypothetical protein